MSPQDKAKNIKLLILDVDGILTQGEIIVDSRGDEIKIFDVQDGMGIVCFHKLGYQTAIITARMSKPVDVRAKDLGITHVYQDAHPKVKAYDDLMAKVNLKDKEVCFIGDDLTDLALLKRVGLSVSVPNGRPEIKEIVDHITVSEGGKGAVREVIEFILKAQNKWNYLLKDFQ